MRHLVVALAMALLLSTAAVAAGSGGNAFITNFGSSDISVVDTATNGLGTPVPVGAGTHGVAVDPKGARAYVVGANGSPSFVYAIDTKSKAVSSVALAVNARSPWGIAVSPDGTRLFVTHKVQVNKFQTVGAVSVVKVSGTGALSLGSTIVVGNGSKGVVVSPLLPDGTYRIYVANTAQYVSVIDSAQIDVPGATPVNVYVAGASLNGVAMHGTRLYAADATNGKLWVIDTTLIGTLADPVVAFVNVGASPFGVAVSPDGKRVFVTNSASNNVTVIDPALIGTPTAVIATTPVGDGPHGVAVTSDSAKAYVVNRYSSTLSVLNGTTGALLSTIKLPELSFPVGFGTFLTSALSITVRIDVVPAVINRKAQGTVPVKIFSSDGVTDPRYPKFDVHDLTTDDLKRIRLNGLSVKIKPNDEPMVEYGDFDGDGLEDMMVHFSMDGAEQALAAASDSTATLEGQTSDGMSFEGTDSVKFLH